MSISSGPETGASNEVVDWTDLGQRMWSFLTGREAAIHYSFEDMAVEVPRDTGPRAPRATWKLNGTLTITTSEHGGSAPDRSGA
ncbi:hypothetical protein [uncultured Nocardioides sp.]|uniref:hypothetical protein n=1 Tax=uncultured Nocardioides sp. TaxID=198441 RepID=UPI0025EEED85|nr:hypothetical protein [uncultured Nocardioides sp.]